MDRAYNVEKHRDFEIQCRSCNKPGAVITGSRAGISANIGLTVQYFGKCKQCMCEGEVTIMEKVNLGEDLKDLQEKWKNAKGEQKLLIDDVEVVYEMAKKECADDLKRTIDIHER